MLFKDLYKKDKKIIIGLLLNDLIIITFISMSMGVIFLYTEFSYISIFNLIIILLIIFIIYERYLLFTKELSKYNYGKIKGEKIIRTDMTYAVKKDKYAFYKNIIRLTNSNGIIVCLPSCIEWYRYDITSKRDNVIDEVLTDVT